MHVGSDDTTCLTDGQNELCSLFSLIYFDIWSNKTDAVKFTSYYSVTEPYKL